jgi:hypothetical protein
MQRCDRYWQLWQRFGADVQPRPLRHAIELHEIEPPKQAWLPVHMTSHAQELPHATFRHDCTPLQLTEHAPGPHRTLSHELRVEHEI